MHTVCTKIMPEKNVGLIWIQTVWHWWYSWKFQKKLILLTTKSMKNYQVGKDLISVELISNTPRHKFILTGIVLQCFAFAVCYTVCLCCTKLLQTLASIENVNTIDECRAICRPTGDKWQSKTVSSDFLYAFVDC